MIDVSKREVKWDRPAVLQYLNSPNKRTLWVGEQLYDGTVAGAVRFFMSQPPEKQLRIEMFVDSGVVSGLNEDTIIGAEELQALANRSDLPQ